LLGHGLLRVVIHVAYGFSRNLGGIQAAGLTMLTLMAIVPLLAIALGVADSLGFHDTLDDGVAAAVKQMLPSSKRSDALIWEVREAVQRVNFEALGMLGSLVLLYTGYVLFTNVEQSLNRVWELRRSRRWYRRIAQFVIVVVIVPVFGLAAILLGTVLHEGPWIHYFPSWMADLYSVGLKLVPHLLLWIAFAALYKFMPATTVPWRGAVVGGAVAGSGWLFLHELYLYFQVGVATWDKIYAGFLALPLLLIYLQAAWSAVLVGAEFSYAVLHIHEMKAPWRAGGEGAVKADVA